MLNATIQNAFSNYRHVMPITGVFSFSEWADSLAAVYSLDNRQNKATFDALKSVAGQLFRAPGNDYAEWGEQLPIKLD